MLSLLKVPINTIAPDASEAVKDAMAMLHEASVPDRSQTAIGQAKHLVDNEITNLTQIKSKQSADQPHSTLGTEDQPSQLFTSIGVKKRCKS